MNNKLKVILIICGGLLLIGGCVVLSLLSGLKQLGG